LFSDGKESKGTVEKQQKCNKIIEINQKIQIFTKLHGNMHFSQQKANYRKCHGHEIMN